MGTVAKVARRIKNRLARFFGTFDLRILSATLAVVVVILGAGAVEDRRSCQRQIPIREAMTKFAQAQATFQGGLSDLDSRTDVDTTTITDPDNGSVLTLTRSGLRKWVQNKQNGVIEELPIPNCNNIPADR